MFCKKMSISYACSWYEPANPEITTTAVEVDEQIDRL
jgi:hypothetical protein